MEKSAGASELNSENSADDSSIKKPPFTKGTVLAVTVEQSTEGAVVVSFENVECTFRGVLIDSTNEIKPKLIRQQQEAEHDDSIKSTLYLHEAESQNENIGSSTQMRYSYQENTNVDGVTLSLPHAPSKTQKQKKVKPRLLRPRLMLCTLCKAKCYERDNETNSEKSVSKTVSPALKISYKAPDGGEDVVQVSSKEINKPNKRKLTKQPQKVVADVETHLENLKKPTVVLHRRDPYEFFDSDNECDITTIRKNELFISPEEESKNTSSLITLPDPVPPKKAKSSSAKKSREKKPSDKVKKKKKSKSKKVKVQSTTTPLPTIAADSKGNSLADEENNIEMPSNIPNGDHDDPVIHAEDHCHDESAVKNQSHNDTMKSPTTKVKRKKKRNRGGKKKNVPISSPTEAINDANTLIPVSSFNGVGGKHFSIGDVIWGKIVGFPWWPGRVCRISSKASENGDITDHIANIDWYGSPTVSDLSCHLLYPFLDYFEARVDKKKKTKGYMNAVAEAKMEASLNAQLSAGEYSDPEVSSLQSPSSGHRTSPPSVGRKHEHFEDIEELAVEKLDFSKPDTTNSEGAFCDGDDKRLSMIGGADSQSVLIDAFLRVVPSSHQAESDAHDKPSSSTHLDNEHQAVVHSSMDSDERTLDELPKEMHGHDIDQSSNSPG